jgi:hypothetical protein
MTRRGIAALLAAAGLATLAPAAPAAAAQSSREAVRIVLERSGGFRGGHDSFAVDRSTVGGHRPLRLAASRDFQRLHPSYRTPSSCCDRYTYRLTVTYRGGNLKTITTIQGASAPAVLWNVITDTERVGVRLFSPAAA